MVQEIASTVNDVQRHQSKFRSLNLPHPTENSELRTQLTKWGMLENMKWCCFGYDKPYHKMQGEDFLMDFLNDPVVRNELQILTKGGEWKKLEETITSVECEMIPTTATSMALFDKLAKSDPIVVRPGGEIVQCMEGFIDGFQICDLLRDLLLNECSENADLFDESEKSEFLFAMLRHFCLGGAINQFENSIEAYIETIKKTYKTLVSAHKNKETDKVEIRSAVYKVKAATTGQGKLDLFPEENLNSYMYITFDPLKRTCWAWYHAFVSYW
ncbi:hypothetical protein BSKO_11852 [Bryopsis sp. KO-2023]|nr:hypothetical protein BSKO_11852 [Bryopsis sp. KO-2023]